MCISFLHDNLKWERKTFFFFRKRKKRKITRILCTIENLNECDNPLSCCCCDQKLCRLCNTEIELTTVNIKLIDVHVCLSFRLNSLECILNVCICAVWLASTGACERAVGYTAHTRSCSCLILHVLLITWTYKLGFRLPTFRIEFTCTKV